MNLPPEFQTDREDGLYSRLSPTGELQAFGYATAYKSIHVDVEKREAQEVTKTSWDADADFQDWLHDWRDRALQASEAKLRCAFCEKSNAEVVKLIAGPTCYICNECIDLCYEIVHSE